MFFTPEVLVDVRKCCTPMDLHLLLGGVETIDVDTPIERLQHSPRGTLAQRVSNFNHSVLSQTSFTSGRGTMPSFMKSRRNLATGRTFMVRHEPGALVSKAVRGRLSAF